MPENKLLEYGQHLAQVRTPSSSMKTNPKQCAELVGLHQDIPTSSNYLKDIDENIDPLPPDSVRFSDGFVATKPEELPELNDDNAYDDPDRMEGYEREHSIDSEYEQFIADQV